MPSPIKHPLQLNLIFRWCFIGAHSQLAIKTESLDLWSDTCAEKADRVSVASRFDFHSRLLYIAGLHVIVDNSDATFLSNAFSN